MPLKKDLRVSFSDAFKSGPSTILSKKTNKTDILASNELERWTARNQNRALYSIFSPAQVGNYYVFTAPTRAPEPEKPVNAEVMATEIPASATPEAPKDTDAKSTEGPKESVTEPSKAKVDSKISTFTEEDDKVLLELKGGNMSWKVIAQNMGRSLRQVKKRHKELKGAALSPETKAAEAEESSKRKTKEVNRGEENAGYCWTLPGESPEIIAHRAKTERMQNTDGEFSQGVIYDYQQWKASQVQSFPRNKPDICHSCQMKASNKSNSDGDHASQPQCDSYQQWQAAQAPSQAQPDRTGGYHTPVFARGENSRGAGQAAHAQPQQDQAQGNDSRIGLGISSAYFPLGLQDISNVVRVDPDAYWNAEEIMELHQTAYHYDLARYECVASNFYDATGRRVTAEAVYAKLHEYRPT